MLKYLKFLTVVFSFIFLSFPQAVIVAEQNSTNRVRVGFFEFNGYHMIDKDGNPSGYGYEILQIIAPFTGWKYEYIGYEKGWSEMLLMLEQGDIDLVTSVTKTPAKEAKFDFSKRPIGFSSTQMTVKAGSIKYKSKDYKNWNGIRIGMITNNGKNEDFVRFAKEKGFNYIPVYFEQIDKMTDALQKEKIDAIVTGSLRRPVNEWIYEELNVQPFYIVVRKGDSERLEKINYALDTIYQTEATLFISELHKKYYDTITTEKETIAFSAKEMEYIKQANKEHRKYTAFVNPDHAPYSEIKNGNVTGIMVDILESIRKQTGLNIQIEALADTETIEKRYEQNKFSLILDAQSDYSNSEKRGIYQSQPYMRIYFSSITKKNFTGKPKRVAVGKNTKYWFKYFKHYMEGMEIIEYPTVRDAINAVKNDKADIVFLNTLSAQNTIEGDRLGTLKTTFLPAIKLSLCVGIRDTEDALFVSIIQKVVRSLSSDEMERIKQKYTIPTSQPLGFREWITLYSRFFIVTACAFLLSIVVVLIVMLRNTRAIVRNNILISKLPLRFFVLDRDERFLYTQYGPETNISFNNVQNLRELVREVGLSNYNKMSDTIHQVFQTKNTITVDIVINGLYRTAYCLYLPISLYGREAVLWTSQDTTELQKTKNMAEKNAQQLKLTLQCIGDGVFVTDSQGSLIMMNPVAEAMTGINFCEILGQSILDILTLRNYMDNSKVENPVEHVLKTGHSVSLANHTDLVRKDGSVLHIADSAAPIKGLDGKILGVILVVRDVTKEYEHRDLEHQWLLRTKAELDRWNVASHIAEVYNFQLNLETMKIAGSEHLSNIWPIHNGMAIPAKEWICPEDLEIWNKAYAEISSSEKKQSIFQYRVIKDGVIRYFKVSMRKDPELPGYVSGLVQEISELMRSQKKQNSLQLLWQTLIDNIPAIMVIKNIDDNFRYITCNNRFATHIGRPINDIIGHTDADLHPNDFEEVNVLRSNDKKAAALENASEYHTKAHDIDGTIRRFLTIKFPMIDEYGRRVLFSIGIDETEDYARQIHLKQLNEDWESAAEIANIAAYRYNIKTEKISGPKRLSEFLKIVDGKVLAVAASTKEYIVSEDVENIKKNLSDIIEGRKSQGFIKYRIVKEDGIHYYRISLRRESNDSDIIRGLIQDETSLVKEQIKNEAINNMWNTIANSMHAILFIKDADNDFKYIFANKELAKLCGCELDDLIGHKESDFVPQQDSIKIHENDLKVLESQEVQELNEVIHDSEGFVHLFRSIKIPSVNEMGHRILIQMTTDITELQELSEVRELVAYSFEQLFYIDTLKEGFRSILQRVCEFIGFNQAYVCCVDEQNDLVRIFTHYEPDNEALLFNCNEYTIQEVSQLPWYQKLMNSVRNDRKVFDFSKQKDLEEATQYIPRVCEKRNIFDIRGAYITFLEINGRPWGYVCGIFQYIPLKKLSVNEEKLLNMLAHVIEISIARHKTFSELQQANVEAKDAERVKSNFSATISHEIRTPLNAVIGFAELLKNNNLDMATREEYISSISSAGKALLALINDVLDISKITMGKMTITIKETSLVQMISDLDQIFRNNRQTKNLQFFVEMPEDFPIIKIDELRIRQVLFNLIGNAIKFTNKGSITVKADFKKETEKEGTLFVSITDTGIGISEKDIKLLCKPFAQADAIRGTATANGGTGLGLAICKNLLELMNGQLKFESTPGKGSTFSFELYHIQYRKNEDVYDLNREEKKPEINIIHANILAVDDVSLNLRVLSAILKNIGATVTTATNAEEALKILETQSFDVLFTDLWMPGLNGVELAKVIRNNPMYEKMRIAVITADVNGQEQFDFSVFDSVLTKPVTTKDLLSFLEKK